MSAAENAGSRVSELPPTRDRIGVVDGLRGLAILGVIYHHYFAYRTPPGVIALPAGPATIYPLTFLSNGWVGVNLFFMLSGFVLDLPYARGRRSWSTPGADRAFYIHRFNRLMPLYLISTLVLALFARRPDVGSARFWAEMLALGTATFPFTPWTFTPRANFVLWSLGLEIWFSVLFPWIGRRIERLGVGPVLAAALAVGLATRYVDVVVEWAGIGLHPHWIKDSLFGRVDDFVLGIAASRWYAAGRVPRGRTARNSLFLAGAALLFVGCSISDAVVVGRLSLAFRPVVYNALQLGFVSVLLSTVAARGEGAAARVFSFPPLRLLGMMCFSLYVWHVDVWNAIAGGSGPSVIRLIAGPVLLFVLSALTYRYIEFGREPDARKLFFPEP